MRLLRTGVSASRGYRFGDSLREGEVIPDPDPRYAPRTPSALGAGVARAFTSRRKNVILTRVETNGGTPVTDVYSYDLRGRLTDVLRNGSLYEHYEYDGNGNRVLLQTPTGSVTGVYDAQDRLLSYGTLVFTYTANGEMATKTDTATSETTAYQYDVRGNLVRVDLPSGDLIEYLIDGQDRRVGKKKNGVPERRWVYRNGLDLVAELDGAGNMASRFVYGPQPNAPEFLMREGSTYRILVDHLASPRVVRPTDAPLHFEHRAQRMSRGHRHVLEPSSDPGRRRGRRIRGEPANCGDPGDCYDRYDRGGNEEPPGKTSSLGGRWGRSSTQHTTV